MQQSSCWEADCGLHTQENRLNVQKFVISLIVHNSKHYSWDDPPFLSYILTLLVTVAKYVPPALALN